MQRCRHGHYSFIHSFIQLSAGGTAITALLWKIDNNGSSDNNIQNFFAIILILDLFENIHSFVRNKRKIIKMKYYKNNKRKKERNPSSQQSK